MRINLGTKFSGIVVGLVALAVFSTAVALLATWHIDRVMRDTVQQNLPSIEAAGELQMALCEPRGFLASYILDGGNRKWWHDLQVEKRIFNERLAQARATVHTSDEKARLDRLESVYREYEARRDDVLRLYDQGDAAEAKRVLFGDVNDLCQQAFELCDEFIAVNRQHAEARLRDVQAHVTWMSSLVSLSLAFVAGLSAWLLWLFFQDVLRPLRRMLAEARHFSGEPPAAAEPAPDELRAVGEHFRALMSDVADTCSSLQRSRSQLLQAEKLAAVGRLAASVAHEIRNPLTAMKMWLFSIRKAVGPDPELDPSFEIDGA